MPPALDVVPRFATYWAAAICICGSLNVNADTGAQVVASENAKADDIQRGFAHVKRITAPKRAIGPEQIGGKYQTTGTDVVVIGSISEASIRSILELIEERDVRRLKTITGDERYAVLEVGDRARDPCCFATALLAKRDGTWTILTGSRVSH